MTDKVHPKYLGLIDCDLTVDETLYLKTEAKIQFKDKELAGIGLIIGEYVEHSIFYSISSKPRDVKPILLKVKKASDKLFGIILSLMGNDIDTESLFLGDDEDEMLSYLNDEYKLLLLNKYGEQKQRTYIENDVNRSALNIIDYNILRILNVDFDVGQVLTPLWLLSHAAEASISAISSKGGRLGDPYLDRFILQLLKAFHSAGGIGTYMAEPLKFLDAARKIAVARLEVRGMKSAALTLRGISMDALQDHVKTVIEAGQSKN